MKRTPVNIRVPSDLLRQARARAKASYKSLSQWVIEAIQSKLNGSAK